MSKRTPNLNLHVWEIPDDNNETFDYKKSIGEPLEQIDEAFGNAVSKFTEPLKYKGQVTNVSDLPSEATSGDIYSVTSLNKNYIWNGTEWVEYSSTLDLTYLENATKGSQMTEEAKSLEITDCAGVNGKLSIKSGETEQESYRGYNELNAQGLQASTENGITFTPVYKNGSLQYINVNGTATANTYYTVSTTEFEANTNYTLHGCPSGGSASKYALFINDVWLMDYGEGRNFILQEAMTKIVRIAIYNGTTVNNLKFYPMIEKGSTIHTYEPYTKKIPAPNPDYPQDIISVGSNVNLFDKDNANILNANINETNIGSSSSAKTLYIPITGGRTYTISKIKSARFRVGTTATTPAINTPIIDFSGNLIDDNTSYTIVTSSTANYLCVYYLSSTDTLTEQEIRNSIKIEKGSQASGYSKYGCGSVDFKVQNKNFANCDGMQTTTTNGMTFTVNKENGLLKSIKLNGTVVNYDAYLVGTSFTLKAGTYKILGNAISNNIVFQILNSTITQQLYYTGMNDTEITVTQDTEVVIRYRVVVGATFNNIELFPKIYLLTETETDYIPHQEQTITVPLPEGMELCKIGDYKDYIYRSGSKWYKHKEIAKVVLDGNENIFKQGEVFTIQSNKFNLHNRIEAKTCLCNYFKSIVNGGYGSMTENNTCRFRYYSGDATREFYILMENETINSFTDWLAQQYANGTPVIVYYILETPVEEEITDTDTLEALYKIEHLLMYEGYTTIECLNDVKPTIQAEYLYNNEINTYWGSKVDELSEMIHILEQKISEVES